MRLQKGRPSSANHGGVKEDDDMHTQAQAEERTKTKLDDWWSKVSRKDMVLDDGGAGTSAEDR